MKYLPALPQCTSIEGADGLYSMVFGASQGELGGGVRVDPRGMLTRLSLVGVCQLPRCEPHLRLPDQGRNVAGAMWPFL